MKKEKYLILRYGGLGDICPVMVVAKQLKDKGHHVTLALRSDGRNIIQSELLKNTNICDKVLDLCEIGPWRNRCVKYKDGWKSIESTYDDYDQIIDYMFITEGNSTCRTNFINKPTDIWKVTRNSNWINWTDQHLAWAGLNPESVSDEEKRPTFCLSQEERKEAKKLKGKYSKLIAIQPSASSSVRSWNQARELIPMLFDKYPNSMIAVWNGQTNDWDYVIKEGRFDKKVKADHPLRKSMIVLHASDIFIGVDTGFTHVAEGLGKKHIAIYSTVPGWTRAKYYKHQTIIDPGIEHPEYYNFCIQNGDPLRIEDGEASLTDRERLVDRLYKERAPIEKVMKELNCDSHGAELELEVLMKKRESWDRQQSKALSSVTAEEVFNKVKELI